MADQDKNRSSRLNDLLRDVFKGDREQLINRSGLTKARISQLLGLKEGQPFGERAARALEQKLRVRKGYLDESSAPTSVNHPESHYGQVTKIIQSELELDAWETLHRVLKALYVYDEDEAEVFALVKRKHEHAAKLMQHLEEIRLQGTSAEPASPAPAPQGVGLLEYIAERAAAASRPSGYQPPRPTASVSKVSDEYRRAPRKKA